MKLEFDSSATAPDTIVAPVAANIAWKDEITKACHAEANTCCKKDQGPKVRHLHRQECSADFQVSAIPLFHQTNPREDSAY